MPEDHTFNGWTNYETWAVNHWLAIEEADHEWLMALSLDPNIASLHDKAKVDQRSAVGVVTGGDTGW